MNPKLAHFFRPPEVFILLTILGLLVTLGTLIARESQKAMRDSERREAITKFYTAANAFKSDYGFYPNYSMVLGVGEDRDSALNYDLASPISQCGDYQDWAVGSDLKTPESNLNKAQLKPGFQTVGRFLKCLGYLSSVDTDPLWSETVADYHYRVSYDYQQVVVEATTERMGVIYQENGLNNRNLWDASDTTIVNDNNYYQVFEGREEQNSKYLYQCLNSNDGRKLTTVERVSKKYAPFIQDTDTSWVPNPACQDKLEALLTVSSR